MRKDVFLANMLDPSVVLVSWNSSTRTGYATVCRIVRTVRMSFRSCAAKTSFLSKIQTVPDCPDSRFQCKGGHCLDLNYVCDGHPDCPDGTDEGRNCSKLSHRRTLNEALDLFSFTFQVDCAKTTADDRICVHRLQKLHCASATWDTTQMMDGVMDGLLLQRSLRISLRRFQFWHWRRHFERLHPVTIFVTISHALMSIVVSLV